MYGLFFDHFHEHVSGKGFWSFDGQAEGTVPDEGSQDAKSSGDAEQDSVVVHFLHAVVLQQDTGMGVYIGPWVLHFAGLGEDWWHHLVDLRY